ncbi:MULTISPECIES: hypothetical protein [Chryseobacterium]|uniref:hypothetical protein n=1 Tax=Chryseobacterium TaxID=59732 RepID=UPI001294AE3C|nr:MULTISPECIES: hypothetical protein [Chryseobacterium]MDR6919699.1 hypothetical protein [Chryseobacterium sp. 2987]
MKKIIITSLLIVSHLTLAQVIFGDETGTAADKTSVLVDFAANQNKGIILPYTRTLPSGTGLVEGTILVDASDAAQAKVKYYNGTWQDLSSGNGANINAALVKQPAAVTEDTKKGAIIGAATSSANGVLILESYNKAMVLPQVNSTDDVINPAAGMMVYINKTGSKRLAVFNGAKWTFWKP